MAKRLSTLQSRQSAGAGPGQRRTGDDANWYRAASLRERLAVARSQQGIAWDRESSDRHLALWRLQAPFDVDAQFTQRLRTDGMTAEDFRRLVGLPATALAQRIGTPAWVAAIGAAYANPPRDAPASPLPAALEHSKLAGFLTLAAPLIRQGCARLRRRAQRLAGRAPRCPFDPAKADALMLGTLPGPLLRVMGRTLVLELNRGRLAGTLSGGTPEERFDSFVTQLQHHRTALELLRSYPVLARQAAGAVERWVASSVEFLDRLGTDWPQIQATFNHHRDPGVLAGVDGSLGDRHRGGRSVLRARFASGFELIYKPRSLSVDVHFQELLAWLDERGHNPAFRTLALLNRGAHGWVELVRQASCTSPDQIRRFFERHGGYLAVLYALEATDFHHENLIAAGEHPMLLDLEALFHPRIDRAGAIGPPEGGPRSAADALAHSVMRVGLLPERVWSDQHQDGIDISGIGAAGGQLSPDAVPQWEHLGTDTMRFVRRRVAIAEGVNRPLLDGVPVNAHDHAAAIEAGFTSTYELLLRHRAALMSADGPLARFADDEVRVIVRPTRIYAKVLDDSFHPDLLRDALDRERFFDRLWVGIDSCPHLVRTIPAEREDLDNADIPLFTTRPGSRDVWTSGGERLPDLLPEPALTSVHRRVRALSPGDLDAQRWFVSASLSTLFPGPAHTARPGPRRSPLLSDVDQGRLVDAARAIGARLEASALRGGEGASWVGLVPRGGHRWSVAPLDIDLYGGLSGVALFLAYLGSMTGDERYAALAGAALSTVLHQVRRAAPDSPSIGAFTGWSGVIYVIGQLGTLWDRSDLLAEAQHLSTMLPSRLEADRSFDIVDGAAGCIAGLLALQACAPDASVLALATRCGDHLVGRAQRMPHGVGWIPERADAPLAGFAHGAAGMAWALLKLAAATGQPRFRAVALEAIAYERSLYSPDARNWPDLRPSPSSAQAAAGAWPSFMTAWCHGAPGIGLARLHSRELLDGAPVRAEIEAAMETTTARGLGGSHCLCHGDLGNVDLLLEARRLDGDRRWSTVIDHTAAGVLHDVERQRFLCGTPSGVESPGLMTGLAGIGYGLLRLARPGFVPSVLVLEPHRAGSAA